MTSSRGVPSTASWRQVWTNPTKGRAGVAIVFPIGVAQHVVCHRNMPFGVSRIQARCSPPLRETDPGSGGLKDFGAAIGIENPFRLAKVTREGLAIVAVTDGPVSG